MRKRGNVPALLVALIAVAIAVFWQHRSVDTPAGSAQPSTVSRDARDSGTGATDLPSAEVQTPRGGSAEQGTPDLTRVAPGDERSAVRSTLDLIAKGGPFPYAKDGAVFSNRERLLPQRPRGYYREYTVPTRAESDRGARRIVRGANGETYYTRDHYRSFVRLDE